MQLLKPGYLVSLKTAIRGGIHYDRAELDPGAAPAPEAAVARWETTRTIEDREEYARAVETRALASRAIRRVCLATSFGLLCPMSREEDLEGGIRSARDLADRFNAAARHSRLEVYVLRGRIAETDEEATRAIAGEVRGLLEDMEAGIRGVDVASVRDAARRARELAAALDAKSAERFGWAIESARAAARAIVRRVEKGGERAAEVLAELDTGPIAAARFAFLELEAEAEPPAEATPAVEVQRFAELELDPEPGELAAAAE